MAERFTIKIDESFGITLPIGLCHMLKLRAGDELEIEADEYQILSVGLYRASIFSPSRVEFLEGQAARVQIPGKYTEGIEPWRKGRVATKVNAAGGESR